MIKNNIILENVRIGFRNFAGKEGKFNPPGKRNFCVFLDTEMAIQLEKNGWNIRWLEPRDENESRQAYMQVAVAFENFPPKIIMITGRGKTALDNDTVSCLDWADIQTVDLIIRPYNYTVNGRSGIKAYVKAMYIVLAEDIFESKYHEPPENIVDSIGEMLCDTCQQCDSTGECRNDY